MVQLLLPLVVCSESAANQSFYHKCERIGEFEPEVDQIGTGRGALTWLLVVAVTRGCELEDRL